MMSTLVFVLFLVLHLTLSFAVNACETAIIGGGIGGAYSAFRLASPSVCLFEAKLRPGGRILTVRDPHPAFQNFTIDLGAYRYHRASHRLVRLVAEEVLEIPTSCYTDLLDRGGECAGPTGRLFATRGKVIGNVKGPSAETVLSRYGKYLPYAIRKRFRWGKGQPLEERRTVFGLVIGPGSVVTEIRDRVEELEAETDYSKAMIIVDEVIVAMRNGSYKGIPYSEISPLQVALREGFTTEEIQLDFDASFYNNVFLRHSLEHLGQLLMREMALEKGVTGIKSQVTPMERTGGVLRRAGMVTIVDGLLQRSVEKGVKLEYGKKAVSVRRTAKDSSTLRVQFMDGTSVDVKNLILNIGKPDLVALGMDSEPLKSSSMEFRRAVERNFVTSLSKTYCFWEDAWWVTKLKTLDGRVRTPQENMNSMRYHDGHVVCEDLINLKGCRGGILSSYSAGDSTGAGMAIHAHTHNEMPYTTLTNSDNVRRLIPGNMTGVEQIYFDDLHASIKRVHKDSLKKLGLDVEKVIPPPEGCVFADWRDVGVHTEMGPGKGTTNIYKLYAKPVEDLNIALVNEAWGQDQGWSEGSLRSAERALFHTFGVEKPEWMDEDFHRSVIQQFNQG